MWTRLTTKFMVVIPQQSTALTKTEQLRPKQKLRRKRKRAEWFAIAVPTPCLPHACGALVSRESQALGSRRSDGLIHRQRRVWSFKRLGAGAGTEQTQHSREAQQSPTLRTGVFTLIHPTHQRVRACVRKRTCAVEISSFLYTSPCVSMKCCGRLPSFISSHISPLSPSLHLSLSPSLSLSPLPLSFLLMKGSLEEGPL